MATKSEMKNKINILTNEYLGFPVNASGLSGMSKSELQERINQLTKAIRFKKYANKINVDSLHGYFAADGTPEKINFQRRGLITRVAMDLWRGVSYEKAKKNARDYQGS